MNTQSPSTLDLVTVDDVAAMLGKSPSSVRWMRHIGELPEPAKIGGRVVWRRQQIIDWVNSLFPDAPIATEQAK
ncbi:helix-turn-helix transcriptional regulator [Branchiibius cervicis]|uniref:Helix-turn-helix transcriptional regulator n=1 Tax=Branchiibius cervicis TaxID=908252 RepID=A0ABW2AVF4_9MICO